MSIKIEPETALRLLEKIWQLDEAAEQARVKWEEADQKAKNLHQVYKDALARLNEAAHPPQPLPLYDPLEEKTNGQATPWQERPITVLGIRIKAAEQLYGHDLKTLGDLHELAPAGEDMEEKLASAADVALPTARHVATRYREYIDSLAVETE